jgi:hypothetical protein
VLLQQLRGGDHRVGGAAVRRQALELAAADFQEALHPRIERAVCGQFRRRRIDPVQPRQFVQHRVGELMLLREMLERGAQRHAGALGNLLHRRTHVAFVLQRNCRVDDVGARHLGALPAAVNAFFGAGLGGHARACFR